MSFVLCALITTKQKVKTIFWLYSNPNRWRDRRSLKPLYILFLSIIVHVNNLL